MFEDLLDADALVAQLDQGALVGAEGEVPGLLDGTLPQAAFAHDRAGGTVRHQTAQHPQHVGAGFQLRPGRHVEQGALHTALLKLEAERCEPVVDVPGERRQGRRSRPVRRGRRRA
ncbi:hypothetical protein GCM10020256_73140 [Streptomyces thermocoprophilus]